LKATIEDPGKGKMTMSGRPKSNSPDKIIKMISRDEELERNDGKWVAKDRPHKNKKLYNRKNKIKLEEDE
jgi:hypothetical protein